MSLIIILLKVYQVYFHHIILIVININLHIIYRFIVPIILNISAPKKETDSRD